MTNKLVFYTHPMSRGRIIRWMLEEVGASYETEVVEYGTTMKSAEYLAINPMGKVPALRNGDMVVTECAAICAYLADAFPDVGLAPAATDPLRGPYYRWLFYAAGPLEAAVTNKALGFETTEDQKKMMSYGSYDDVITLLDNALSEKEYIVGNRMTAADVYLGAHIGWGLQFGTIEKRPSFERYFEMLSARPAAIKAREIDDALLANAS